MSIAKDLIRHLLKTDPEARLKIGEVLKHPWIAVSWSYVTCLFITFSSIIMYVFIPAICTVSQLQILCIVFISLYPIQGYQKVPQTPLVSVSVLQDEKDVWNDVQVGLYIHIYGWSCPYLVIHCIHWYLYFPVMCVVMNDIIIFIVIQLNEYFQTLKWQSVI